MTNTNKLTEIAKFWLRVQANLPVCLEVHDITGEITAVRPRNLPIENKSAESLPREIGSDHWYRVVSYIDGQFSR